MKILFLSFTCEDIGVGRHGIFLFIRILTFWNRKYKYYCRYFSLITLYPSFKTFLWRAFCDGDPFNCTILLFRKMNFKKSCILCRNFIGVYKINRKLHGRLGIRISSSRISARPCNILNHFVLVHIRLPVPLLWWWTRPKLSRVKIRRRLHNIAWPLHGFSLASKVRNELSLIRLRFWWKQIYGNLTREICVPLHRYVV